MPLKDKFAKWDKELGLTPQMPSAVIDTTEDKFARWDRELGIGAPAIVAPPETLATPQMGPVQPPITAGGLPQLPGFQPAEAVTTAAPIDTGALRPLAPLQPGMPQDYTGVPELREFGEPGRAPTEAESLRADINRERQWLSSQGKVPMDVATGVLTGFVEGMTGIDIDKVGGVSPELRYKNMWPVPYRVAEAAGMLLLFGGAMKLGAGATTKILQQPYVRRVLLSMARRGAQFAAAGGFKEAARQVVGQRPVSPKGVAVEAGKLGAWGAGMAGVTTGLGPLFKTIQTVTKTKGISYTFTKETVAEIQRGVGVKEAEEIAKLMPNWRQFAADLARKGGQRHVTIPPEKVIQNVNKPWFQRFLKSLQLDRLNRTKGYPLPKEAPGVGAPPIETTGYAPVPAKVIKGMKPPTLAPPTGKLFEVKPTVPTKRAPKPAPTAAEVARVEKEKAAGLFGPGRGRAAEQLKIVPKPSEKQLALERATQKGFEAAKRTNADPQRARNPYPKKKFPEKWEAWQAGWRKYEPTGPRVTAKIGREKLEIPEKRLAETKEVRAKIDEMIDKHAEVLAGQFLEAPKGERFPIYDQEGYIARWEGAKTSRHEALREYTTKQVKKALAEKKGYVWKGLREVARSELEEGGTAIEGEFPANKEFLKLVERAEGKPALAPAEVKKLPEQIDKLHREVQERNHKLASEISKAKFEGREPETEKIMEDLTAKERALEELTEEQRMMGGEPPPTPDYIKHLEWSKTHDALTGKWNREAWDGLAAGTFKKGGDFSVLFGDVDHFGKMQDIPGRGHDWGDKAIKDYFNVVEKVAKKYGGFAGRYGGDEMMVGLPGKTEEQAVAIARKIREAVAAQGLAGVDASTSIGVAARTAQTKTVRDLLKRADRALYEAKEAGRDRVLTFKEIDTHLKAEAAGIKDAEQTPPQVKAKEITDQLDIFKKEKTLTAKVLDKLIDIRANAEDFIWAFGYQRVRYPGLRERALEAYHRRAASGGTAAHKALKIIGKQKLSEQERAYMSFVHEDKSLTTVQKADMAKELGIKDADKLDKTRSTIADAIKASAKAKVDMGIMERPWPESAIYRNNEEITMLQAKGILNQTNRERLEVLKKDNEVLADFNWLTHKDIPNLVREAFKQKFSAKARARLKTRPQDLSYLYKKRKGRLTLYDLHKRGIIDLKDASMTKLFMEGLAETEQKMAMKQLYDYVKASGFVKQADAVKDPSWLPVKAQMVGFYSPEYSGKVMHPAAVRMYQTMTQMMRPELSLPERIMAPIYAAIKLATFGTRPGLLFTYDAVFQKAMAGAWALNPKAEAAAWGKAVTDVLLKTDDYIQNDIYGLYQRMDIGRKATIDEVIKMTERQIASEIPDWKNQLEKLAGMSFTKDEARKILYAGINPVTNIAWTGDEIARTQGAEMLVKMGFTRKEACQIIAHKYGPYSELGIGYKRFGRFIFYVMTFKVNMPLEFTKSIAIEPVRAIIQAIRAKRGLAEPLTKAQWENLAKKFIGPIIVAGLTDWYLTHIRGFKRDKPSVFIPTQNWKYRKAVRFEVAPGKYETKELVIGVNNIYNIPTKVIMRAIAWDPLRDPDPRGWQAAKNMMRWEWHPANMVIWDCITNRRRFGTGKVYNPKETNHAIIARDCAKYALASWFRLYGAMTTAVTGNDFATGITPTERQRQKKIFKEGLIWLDRLITENAGYKYVRAIPFDSWKYIVKEIDTQYNREKNRLAFALLGEAHIAMTPKEKEKLKRKYDALIATNENWKNIVTEHYRKMYPKERLREGIQ